MSELFTVWSGSTWRQFDIMRLYRRKLREQVAA